MGLFIPQLQDPSQELHPLPEELFCLLQTGDGGALLVDNAGRDLVQNTPISDYELGAGDLFKAPEAILEEPVTEFDPVKAAISMMSNDGAITAEAMKVTDIDPTEGEALLSEVLCDCNDPLASSATEDTFDEPSDVKIPALQIEEGKKKDDEVVRDGTTQRSVSSSCLISVDWTHEGSARPNFLDLQRMDLGSLSGIRRTYSEGDIQVLGNGNMSHANPIIVYPPLGNLLSTGDHKIEERRRKISRYRKKKTKRNFGRKIKYACRKALADSQPRIRGRFARVEECEASK